MQVDSPDKIRNVALAGHNDSGKTTLVSALLHASGVTNRLNKVEDGGTTTDFDEEEIERGISIGVATAFAPWRQHKINLLDTPGYNIFMTEIESGLRAADVAAICVNTASGIEVTTDKVWQVAESFSLPTIFHCTKMDRERADFEPLVAALQERFNRACIPVQLPIGTEAGFEGVVDLIQQKAYRYDRDGDGKASPSEIPDELADKVDEWRNQLLEAVAESDEELMEAFFENGTLTDEEMVAGLRTAINQREIFPITMSTALHGIGPSALLDSIVDLLPAPSDRPPFPATNVGGDPVELAPAPDAPTAALVFKTLNDPFSGRVSLLRVASGTLSSDTVYWNTRAEDTERIGSLMALQGKQGQAVPKLICGDIGGVAKLKESKTGDTLCTKDQPVNLQWIEVPQPAISFAVEPKSKGDEEKIGEALSRLMDEDIGTSSGRDPSTGEFLLSGSGQLHVEITVAKLKKRFKTDVILHPPKVPYRETIKARAEGHGRHKKQSGGRGQFADCKIVVEPMPRGEEYEFVDEIFGGSIPQNYRPAVDKGIQEASAHGYSTGFPVVDFRVRLIDGQYHDVDSSEMAFKIAGSLAFKDAMTRARPTLLEPIMQLEVTTSEEFMGDIMGDLSQRRGKPQGMDTRSDGTSVVKAQVPMAEMLDYSAALTSKTQGRASFTMAYSHYEEVPKSIQDKIVQDYQREREQAAS